MTSERGNATVEFVAVVPLLFVVGMGVLQLALLAHAQGIVGAAASEAARAAAVSVDPGRSAREAAQAVMDDALGGVPISGFQLTGARESGLPVVAVEVRARPQLLMLPDVVEIAGTGRALVEAAP